MSSKHHAVSLVLRMSAGIQWILKTDQDDIKHSTDKCCVTIVAHILWITPYVLC